MPNRNYTRGRASEYKAQRELEALGYQTARTAGSHGAADVIAWNGRHVRFIQIKTYKKRAGDYREDLDKIAKLHLPVGSQAELWVRQIGKPGWQKQEVLRAHLPIQSDGDLRSPSR